LVQDDLGQLDAGQLRDVVQRDTSMRTHGGCDAHWRIGMHVYDDY